MSEQVSFMLPQNEHFDPNADQNAYDREFYAIAAAEGDFEDVFGSGLTVDIDANRLLVASNGPDTFTKKNTDTDPGNPDGD